MYPSHAFPSGAGASPFHAEPVEPSILDDVLDRGKLPGGCRLVVDDQHGEAELHDPAGQCRTRFRYAPPASQDRRAASERYQSLRMVLDFADRYLLKSTHADNWALVSELTLDGDVLRMGSLPLARVDPSRPDRLKPLPDVNLDLRFIAGQMKYPTVGDFAKNWSRLPDLNEAIAAAGPRERRRDSHYDETYLFQVTGEVDTLRGLVAKHPHATRCFILDHDGVQRELPVPGYQPSPKPIDERRIRFTVNGDSRRQHGRPEMAFAGRTPTALSDALVAASQAIATHDGHGHVVVPKRVSLIGSHMGIEPFLPPPAEGAPQAAATAHQPWDMSQSQPQPQPTHYGEALLAALSERFGSTDLSVTVRRDSFLVLNPKQADAPDKGSASNLMQVDDGNLVGRKLVRGQDGDYLHQAPGGTELVSWDAHGRLQRRDKYVDHGQAFIKQTTQKPMGLMAWLAAAGPDVDPPAGGSQRHRLWHPLFGSRSIDDTAVSTSREPRPQALPPTDQGTGREVIQLGEVTTDLSTLRAMGLNPNHRTTDALLRDLRQPSAFLNLRFDPRLLMDFISQGPVAPRIQALRLIKQMLRNQLRPTQLFRPLTPGALPADSKQAADLVRLIGSAVDDQLRVAPSIWHALWGPNATPPVPLPWRTDPKKPVS